MISSISIKLQPFPQLFYWHLLCCQVSDRWDLHPNEPTWNGSASEAISWQRERGSHNLCFLCWTRYWVYADLEIALLQQSWRALFSYSRQTDHLCSQQTMHLICSRLIWCWVFFPAKVILNKCFLSKELKPPYPELVLQCVEKFKIKNKTQILQGCKRSKDFTFKNII